MHPILLIRKWESRLQIAGWIEVELNILLTATHKGKKIFKSLTETVHTKELEIYCSNYIEDLERAQLKLPPKDRYQDVTVTVGFNGGMAEEVIATELGDDHVCAFFRMVNEPIDARVVSFGTDVDRFGIVRPLVHLEANERKLIVRLPNYSDVTLTSIQIGSEVIVVGVHPHASLMPKNPSSESHSENQPVVQAPTTCRCGGTVQKAEGQPHYRCLNAQCFIRALRKFDYAHREIGFLQFKRPEVIRELFLTRAVKDLYWLFDLAAFDLISLEEDTNRQELIDDITYAHSFMDQRWDWELLASLSIETLSVHLCKRICEKFNYRDFVILTESDLRTISELSEKNIHHFLDYFKQEGANAYPWLFWWVGLQLNSSLLVKSKRFENDFVFFHGPFTRLWELQCMVAGHGGVVRVNYSPIVTIVVVSDQVHLLDAQALYPDVEVVTETMFLESIK